MPNDIAIEIIQIMKYFKFPLSNKDLKNGQHVLSYYKSIKFYEFG